MAPTADNLRRIMADQGLTVAQVADARNLDERTVRGVLNGSNHSHARTLGKLARGLGVPVSEFFIPPAALAVQQFDEATNPAVDEVLGTHAQMVADWTAADFAELYSRVGTGGGPAADGVLEAIRAQNRRREVFERVAVLLESDEATMLCGMVDLLYRKAVADQ